MSKSKFLKLHCGSVLLLALLFSIEPLGGTAISAIIVPAGIFIAADGKTIQYLNNQRVPPIGRVSKKLRLLHHSLLIGSYGVAKIGADPHPAYYLGSFFDNTQREVGAHTTVSEAAQIVAKRAATAMAGFNDLLAAGIVTRDAFIKQMGHDNPLAGFVVAGYESGEPKLFNIVLEIDWTAAHLRAPAVNLLYPSNNPENNFFNSDQEKLGPYLLAWTKCRVPRKDTHIQHAEATVRAAIDLAIEIDGDNVGLPITSVTFFPNGSYHVRRYHTRLPDLCSANQAGTGEHK
jgi:hypothetical protein